jgi:alpha-beta hydrolase superfamily lysophospholipase
MYLAHDVRLIDALMSQAGYRAYSLDLLGNGRSSKPFPYGEVARELSGEKNRPEVCALYCVIE